VPESVREYAVQAVTYVKAATNLELSYDSDTLPILDHYLRELGTEDGAVDLVAATSGAYFGEVVRRALGGTWSSTQGDPGQWRLVLPGGLSFVPAGMTMAAVRKSDDGGLETKLSAPTPMQSVLEEALERMGALTEAEYFTLGCRFDTLEHLQSVLLACAAARLREQQAKLN